MSSSERTQEALLARTESLCTSITDMRSSDPWGGTGYLSTILRATRLSEHSPYADSTSSDILPGAFDYASSAHRELLIREQTAGLIKTTQEISGLVRELQELWLFGGLETVRGEEGGMEERRRVEGLADEVEGLVRSGKKTEEKGDGKEEGSGGEGK